MYSFSNTDGHQTSSSIGSTYSRTSHVRGNLKTSIGGYRSARGSLNDSAGSLWINESIDYQLEELKHDWPNLKEKLEKRLAA